MLNIIKKIIIKKLSLKTAFYIVLGFSIISITSSWGINIYNIKKAQAWPVDIGGRIPAGPPPMSYNPACVLDTPVIAPVTCAVSCPICTGFSGSACAAQEQIIAVPFGGTTFFFCPPKGFPYIGMPGPGLQIYGGGATQIAPIQLGAGP